MLRVTAGKQQGPDWSCKKEGKGFSLASDTAAMVRLLYTHAFRGRKGAAAHTSPLVVNT
jgi:hypothetical protein